MRLFIDDERKPPPGWVGANTITEACRLLIHHDTGLVEEIAWVSLDFHRQCTAVYTKPHGIGETFEPAAWLLTNLDLPPRIINIHIHSIHKESRPMLAMLLNHKWRRPVSVTCIQYEHLPDGRQGN